MTERDIVIMCYKGKPTTFDYLKRYLYHVWRLLTLFLSLFVFMLMFVTIYESYRISGGVYIDATHWNEHYIEIPMSLFFVISVMVMVYIEFRSIRRFKYGRK